MTYHNCTIINQSIDQSTNRSGSSVQGPHTGSGGQQQQIGAPPPPRSLTTSDKFDMVEKAYGEHSHQLSSLRKQGRRHSQTLKEANDVVRQMRTQIGELQNQSRGLERTWKEASDAFVGHGGRIDELERETRQRRYHVVCAQSGDVEDLRREQATLNRRVGNLERQGRNADMLEHELNRRLDRLQERWLDLTRQMEDMELRRGGSRAGGAT